MLVVLCSRPYNSVSLVVLVVLVVGRPYYIVTSATSSQRIRKALGSSPVHNQFVYTCKCNVHRAYGLCTVWFPRESFGFPAKEIL